jgi:hypothetical protein
MKTDNNDQSSIPVISTRYVMFENLPVLEVVHDEEGDWQFYGGQEISESDAVFVSLKQVLARDHSIESLLGMPRGSVARRENESCDWIVEMLE